MTKAYDEYQREKLIAALLNQQVHIDGSWIYRGYDGDVNNGIHICHLEDILPEERKRVGEDMLINNCSTCANMIRLRQEYEIIC